MGNNPARDGGTTCAHPPIGAPDQSQTASASDQYAARHNPFVYFHSIIDRPVCAQRDVPTSAASAGTWPGRGRRPTCRSSHPTSATTATTPPARTVGPVGCRRPTRSCAPWCRGSPAPPPTAATGCWRSSSTSPRATRPPVAASSRARTRPPGGPVRRPRRRPNGRRPALAGDQARHQDEPRLQPLQPAAEHRGPLRPAASRLRRGVRTAVLRPRRLHRPMSARTNRLTRRTLLAGGATAAGALAVGRWPARAHTRPPSHPSIPPFEHVVVLMMENRSFDHFLGWLPDSRRPPGRPGLQGQGGREALDPLAGSGLAGLRLARIPTTPTRADGSQYNGGALRRLAAGGSNDDLLARLLPPARTSPSSARPCRSGPRSRATSRRSSPRPTRTASTSTPAQTDRLHNSTTISHAADDLGPAGGWRPTAAATTSATSPSSRSGDRSTSRSAAPTRVLRGRLRRRARCRRSRSSTRASRDEDSGTSGDDHPHADIRNGEAFMGAGLQRGDDQPRLVEDRAA